MKNYYQILGLEPNATKEDIRKAHREYAINFHPDKQGGSKFFEERFREIQEAYEMLSDDKERTDYDLIFNQRFNSRAYSNASSSHNEAAQREGEQKEPKAETSKSLSSIRYDGVYYSQDNSGNSILYLRFYSDSTVISAHSADEIIQMKTWFNKEVKHVSIGIYNIIEERVSFQTKSSHGILEYNGQVYEDKLILDFYVVINGYKGKNREFLFVSW